MREKFTPREFVPAKHPFVPHKETVDETFVPREKEMFEAAEAVGNVVDGEIYDFGCEC